MSSYQEASGKPGVLLELNQNLRDWTDWYSPTLGRESEALWEKAAAGQAGGRRWLEGHVSHWMARGKQDNCPPNNHKSGLSALHCTKLGASAQPHFEIKVAPLLLLPHSSMGPCGLLCTNCHCVARGLAAPVTHGNGSLGSDPMFPSDRVCSDKGSLSGI